MDNIPAVLLGIGILKSFGNIVGSKIQKKKLHLKVVCGVLVGLTTDKWYLSGGASVHPTKYIASLGPSESKSQIASPTRFCRFCMVHYCDR